METIFGIKVNNEIVEVAKIDILGNKPIVTIINPLLYRISENIKFITLKGSFPGIETVEDIIRYKDNIFDDGFRPIGNRVISPNDKCIKCGHTYIKHIFSSKFCPKK